MRIAFVNGVFPQLSQTFVLDQIEHAEARGHEVEVVAAKRTGAAPPERAARALGRIRSPQMSLRRKQWSRLQGMSRAMAAAGRLQRLRGVSDRDLLIAGALRHAPDVLIANFGTNLPLATTLKTRFFPSAKLVCVFHGFDVTKYPREHGWSSYRRLAPHLDLAFAVNRPFAESLARNAGFQRVEVLHLGVDGRRLPTRARHRDRELALLFVGRMVEKKGAQYLLEALELLEDLPLRLHLVGDGPLLAELKMHVKIRRLHDRVVFYGAREHRFVLSMMAAADCLIAPSVTALDGDTEGIPIVLMEAMAMGVPVVSTIHSGIPELIEHERHGRLVPERDAAALARAIRSTCENPGQYVAAARAHVHERFSPLQYDRFLGLVEQLAAGRL